MPERPAPVVTVSVPGQGGSGDLLGVEPPPRLPATRAQRGLVAAAAAVLLAGLVVVSGEQSAPVTAAAEPVATPDPVASAASVTARPTDSGVTAVATDPGLPNERFSVRLVLTVQVAGVGGPGDSQSPSSDDEVTLLGLSAQGFELRLTEVGVPFSLGPAGRAGVAGEFDLEVAVTDCSVPTQAQRRLDLQLRRGDGPTAQVRVSTATDVVRRLDRLVAGTCRRPRG